MDMKVRGILQTKPQVIKKALIPIVTNLLVTNRSLSSIDNRKNSFDEILRVLKRETIDHSEYQARQSSPKQEDINYHLVEEMWVHIKEWGKKYLNVDLGDSCRLHVLDKLTYDYDAAGLFLYNTSGDCRIEIKRDVMRNTPYFLVVLVHEYMHYVHFKLVSRKAYYNCPILFCEGFAEHASRVFHEQSNYSLPSDLRKSWNENYELGRLVVNQICSEGFGLSGFVQSFLKNTLTTNSWSKLDSLFK